VVFCKGLAPFARVEAPPPHDLITLQACSYYCPTGSGLDMTSRDTTLKPSSLACPPPS
jgi:hypothetical protein